MAASPSHAVSSNSAGTGEPNALPNLMPPSDTKMNNGASRAAERTPERLLMHQMGNHLQSIRGELELLRMSGELCESTFESVAWRIDAIHALITELGMLTQQKSQRDSLGDSLRPGPKQRNRAHRGK